MVTRVNLLKILEFLLEKEFEDFKWLLENESLAGYQTIKTSQLENAGRRKTVDLMVQTYQLHGAVEVTKKLLKTINMNDLWQILSYISGSKDISELTVDRNKLKRFATVPDNKRELTYVTEGQYYQSQLMCTEDLTDHSYWEFKWRGWVDISMTYRGMRGKGNSYDRFGQNDQSRSLSGSDDEGNSLAQKEKNTPSHLILIHPLFVLLLLINLFLIFHILRL
ncbi:uncharacterized protein LOC133987515 [Scomber scombrus]|uniref:uncharacterized protein LOC133987515 n=1 Tax=Scomber scombrus TaxID=13677 RepID=UPI002DDBB708|nr:uncharacterized protein LOC133987515 [Scomber scombrus]